mgnify:CR=1 FL=1
MNLQIRQLLKIRAVKITLEIFFILLIYMLLKTWMQRRMIEGPAPQIQGTLLNGQTFDMKQLGGKPALIHFWASWCGICKLEQDSINAISKEHTVITIPMNSGDKQEVQEFMHDNNLSFPVINDPDGKLSAKYGVRAVPASFILNPAGEISFKEVGYTTNWGLRFRLWLASD